MVLVAPGKIQQVGSALEWRPLGTLDIGGIKIRKPTDARIRNQGQSNIKLKCNVFHSVNSINSFYEFRSIQLACWYIRAAVIRSNLDM